MTRILFVGQKPETVDFSDPSLPPGFDAEKINAGIAVAVAQIRERGWEGDTCMITPDDAGRAMLETQLNSTLFIRRLPRRRSRSIPARKIRPRPPPVPFVRLISRRHLRRIAGQQVDMTSRAPAARSPGRTIAASPGM